jgi:serine/threonine protein kinase/TolB-like protein
MPLAAGTRLGPYEVLELIGAGGMGEVYEARDTRLGRTVALKLLPSELGADPERRARFEREARAIASLAHPHICTLFDVGEDAPTSTETRIRPLGAARGGLEGAEGPRPEPRVPVHYLVMERLRGETLAERLREGRIPLPLALEVGAQIAEALDAAHTAGIVHRDLKPGNIMLTTGGAGRSAVTSAKLLDFGLAKLAAHGELPALVSEASAVTHSAPMTARGTILGTLPYMAPEQLEGKASDARTDIWALGAILYEMVTGRRAFLADNDVSLIGRILNAEPPALATIQPATPTDLDRAVRKCLAKAPAERWETAHDVAEELRRIAHAASAPAPPPAAEEVPAPASQRRWRFLAAGVAGLVVFASLTAWIAMRPAPKPPAPPGDAPIRSLAVLPLDNLMHDAAQDFFVEGMHEALITELNRLGTVKVTPRLSVMRYKGQMAALADIARELGVDAVISGSVLRAGSRVRITAQLVRGTTDEHLWAENYDRELGDVLILLSEVSRAIAVEVRNTLTPGQSGAPLPAQGAVARVKPEAYDAYLRGRYETNLARASGEFGRGLPFFEEAVRLDPTFAAAHSAIGGAHNGRWFDGQASAAEAVPLARAAARRALALDPRDSRAHSVLGYVALYFDWDFAAAREHFELAVALDPHEFVIRHAYCDYFMVMGDLDKSLEQVRLGRDMAPTAPLASRMLLSHLATTDKYEETLAEARHALETFANFRFAHQVIGDTLWKQGRYEEALPELREAFASDAGFWKVFERAYRTGGPRAAKKALAAHRVEQARTGQAPLVDAAAALAEAGDADAAFAWIEKAYAARAPQLLHVLVLPAFQSIRSDPRYLGLLKRIGLPAPAPASVAPRPR